MLELFKILYLFLLWFQLRTTHSGSMEPAFYRGDLLLLTNYETEPFEAGEIIVYKIRERDIPIVHRVLKVHEAYVLC